MELHLNGVTVLATLWAGVILLGGVTFLPKIVPQILPTLAAFLSKNCELICYWVFYTVFWFTVVYFIAWRAVGKVVFQSPVSLAKEVKRAPAAPAASCWPSRCGNNGGSA